MALDNDLVVRWYEQDDTTSVDVSSRVRAVNIERGRRSGLDPIRAGTCTFEMWNNDGEYDMWDSLEPHYEEFYPGSKVEVLQGGSARMIFAGRIETIQPAYGHRNRSSVKVSCVDGLAELAGVRLGYWTPAMEPIGTRVTNLFAQPALDEFTWPTSIATGATTAGAFPVFEGTPAVTYLNRLIRSEQGFAFMSRSGTFTFQGRYDTASANNLEFRHSATGTATSPKLTVPIVGMTARSSFDDFVNQVSAATEQGLNSTGAVTTVTDTGTVRRVVAEDLTDLLCDTDGQAAALAQLIIDRYADPTFRVTSVDVHWNALDIGVADACLTSEIGDLVRVVYRGPGGSVDYDRSLRVEGISHAISGTEHRIRWHLSPNVVDLTGLFIIGTSLIGGSDVLAA